MLQDMTYGAVYQQVYYIAPRVSNFSTAFSAGGPPVEEAAKITHQQSRAWRQMAILWGGLLWR